MRKLFIIFAILILSLSVSAQVGKAITLAVDSLNGAETVNFEIFELTRNQDFVVQALCTQVGGTSDGTLALYGSVDRTSFSLINAVGAEVITASPQASITGADLNQITITNALVASWAVRNSPYRYYRITGVGTASDSTQVNIKYMYW